MASHHKRNVHGMHAAPRCDARTEKGKPCCSPAIQGKTRCRVHGGKGSKAQAYPYKFGDYTKASIERDRQITDAIRGVEKVIRDIALRGLGGDLIGRLEKIKRQLKDLTQQREADLARDFALSPAEAEQHRQANLRLSYAHTYDTGASGTRERVRDRALGAILGLAVGEAVGITMEGQPRDSCDHRLDMEGGGILGLACGQWAGDTAMALALLQSLQFRGGFDATDFIERLTEWKREGAYACTGDCTGIGEVTSDALNLYSRLGDPFSGDENPDCLDSGSLARIAPVAIRYWNDTQHLREVAAEQSRTTHANFYAVEACVTFAELLADGIAGYPREVVFRERSSRTTAIDSIASGSWKRKRREDIRSTNNVLALIDASLWCVNLSDSFADAVLRATNLGHDAGTVAALTGQLAGAIYGASSIPEGWIDDLAWNHQITEWAEPLIKAGLV